MKIENCGVVDLFCGVGGITHGFVLEGYNVIAGIDADKSCEYAYSINNNAQFIERDIAKLESHELIDLYNDVKTKILIGCAPCQPFSQYTGKKRQKKTSWALVRSYARLIKETQPDVVSMENVPLLKNHPVFQEFLDMLDECGYQVCWDIVHGPDYGLAQDRDRLILLASKLGEISLISPTHKPHQYRTVRDTISHLPPLAPGEKLLEDPLHMCSNLTEINLKRIRASKPGGTWRDWPPDLLAECHKRDSGKGYVSVYGRMDWESPSPTITTQFNGYGNGRFGHPEQNRAISLREGAILQSFPITYDFLDPNAKYSIKTIATQIGNAVPVLLGQIIAKSIKIHLEQI